jgi:hypothetical protein
MGHDRTSNMKMISLDNNDFKTFEKEALAFLKTLNFTVTGYYPYDLFSDLSGYLQPVPPFKIPSKVMVEITKVAPNITLLSGFYKSAKDSLSSLMILICPTPLSDLSSEIQSYIERMGIEFFDRQTILNTLKEKKISKSVIEGSPELYDVVGPVLLASALPEVSLQRIPKEMEEYVEKIGLKPWQVLEDIVFSIFNYCFSYPTEKLGGERLFEHEPEGIVVIGDMDRFAIMYECKSAEKEYTMSSDHGLRYRDYIHKKSNSIRVLRAAGLRYFVIVAPGFGGDIKERREKIFRDTQVLTIFMPAIVLAKLGLWACKLPNDIKKLIELESIFKLEESIVTMDTVQKYIKEFEKKRSRW